MKRISRMILVCMILVACESEILGPDEENTPENNFDLLWDDLDKHYSLFYIKGTNWDSLYTEYRPRVTGKTTEAELWSVMCNLIETLNDSHTVLYGTNGIRAYTSGFKLGKKAIDEEFNLRVITRVYVENFNKIEGEGDLGFGKIKNRDVGYTFLREEHGNDPEGAITHILDQLKQYKAIILDLRTNDGGDKRYSKIIAGGFSNGEHIVGTVQTRNGPKHSDFDAKANEVTQLTGSFQFHKPVVVLTDRATISGGEYLTLHMKTFSHVTQIGDTTAGDFSAVGTRSFLPNGWSYQYSIQMFLLPDGRSLDGTGIAPNIYVKNTKATIDARTDVVLEKALNFLFEMYGID